MEQGNISLPLNNNQKVTNGNIIFKIEKVNRFLNQFKELALNYISLQNQGLINENKLTIEMNSKNQCFIQITRPLKFMIIDDFIPISIRQYDRIVKRRLEREGSVLIRRDYCYESRHRIALKRKRGERGRFLKTRSTEDCSIF